MARPPYVSVTIRGKTPGQKAQASDIVEGLLGEIRGGRLPAGSRLPPVRALEHQLGISKNTAQAAYDELVARGAIEAREREGVFVARLPEAPPPKDAPAPPLPRLRDAPPLPRQPTPKGVIALSTVFIDPELLPRERLADCIRSVLRSPGLEPMYGWQGHPPLREAIAARLRARGMAVTAAQVITTAGSQQGLDIVCRALAGRRVAMEDPVYPHARLLFESHGFEALGLKLDPFCGLALDDWERELSRFRPDLAYAITSFQNPTGYSYSTSELLALLSLSARYGFALLEDDWGSDMLSCGEYRPTLRSLGGEGVVYLNSFTKKLLPSLRIGFLVASEALIPAFVGAKRLSTLGNPTLLEATLCEFLERGYYDTHLAALQSELDRRYERCLAALRALMPEGVRFTTPGGGPTLWLDLPRQVDLAKLSRDLLARDVQIEDPSLAFFGAPHLHGFRVSYAFLPEGELTRGLEILGEELKKQLG